jgi:hypothetical protein
MSFPETLDLERDSPGSRETLDEVRPIMDSEEVSIFPSLFCLFVCFFSAGV